MSKYGYAKAKRAKQYQAGVNVSYGYAPVEDDRGPFGPGVAQDIFDCRVYDDCETAYDDGHEVYHENLHPTDLFDPEEGLQSYHFQYQPHLELETPRELESRLRDSIRKFERSWDKMAIYALKWHYLMEELEEDSQLKKQFMDIQLMRKLKGSDRV